MPEDSLLSPVSCFGAMQLKYLGDTVAVVASLRPARSWKHRELGIAHQSRERKRSVESLTFSWVLLTQRSRALRRTNLSVGMVDVAMDLSAREVQTSLLFSGASLQVQTVLCGTIRGMPGRASPTIRVA